MADEAALLELIAANKEGVLAVVKNDGYPHLSNIWYVWDPVEGVARISTTAERVKARVLRRDPHAALHVSGPHFFSWAVAEGNAELSDVTTTPGDATGLELLPVYEAFNGPHDREALFERLVAERRLVIRLHVKRVYGLTLDKPPFG
jgi:PPOX class probable F420-dependent enzyme